MPAAVLNQGYQGARIREYQDQDRGWGYQGSLILGSEAPVGIQGTSGISGISGMRIKVIRDASAGISLSGSLPDLGP